MAQAMKFMALTAMNKVKAALKNERGDTNIISIIVILAIVIALAIAFKTQLTTLFNSIWSKFSNVGDQL